MERLKGELVTSCADERAARQIAGEDGPLPYRAGGQRGQRELEELRKLFRDRELEVEKLSTLAEQARTEIDQTAVQRAEL
jgi:hypothetical protein